jgi:predicted amino acid dehydrogenase
VLCLVRHHRARDVDIVSTKVALALCGATRGQVGSAVASWLNGLVTLIERICMEVCLTAA